MSAVSQDKRAVGCADHAEVLRSRFACQPSLSCFLFFRHLLPPYGGKWRKRPIYGNIPNYNSEQNRGSKNYENYSFYNPRFLSPYMGLFLSQRWSVFIIVRSLFARVIKIAHCSFFSAFCAWTKSALVVYQRAISLRGNAGMSVQGQDFGALLYGVSYGVPPNFRKMALGVKLGDDVQNCPERG